MNEFLPRLGVPTGLKRRWSRWMHLFTCVLFLAAVLAITNRSIAAPVRLPDFVIFLTHFTFWQLTPTCRE